MIAIVCGGRDYADAARVKLILDAAVERLGLATIIEGTATGADTLVREWAEARGDIAVISVKPTGKWPEAGPIRNKLMLDILMGGDDEKAVIVFPGGRGTENMVKQGEGAGIRVIRA